MNQLIQQFQADYESHQKYVDALFVVITKMEDNHMNGYIRERLIEEFKIADKAKHATFKSFLENLK